MVSDSGGAVASGSGSGLAIAIASSVTIVVVLPLFLVGALAVQVRAELGITVAGLGMVVAGYRAFTAVIAIRVGRLVDHLGAAHALRAGAGLSALAMLGIALQPRSWVGLSGWLLIAAVAFAFGQTSVNRFLSLVVPEGRRGIAFGLKQSSVPTATLVAGAAVPVIALTIGWRWAFAAAAVVGLVVMLSVPNASSARMASSASSGVPPVAPPRRDAIMFAVAFGLAMTAASPLGVFLVDHAVQAGFGPGSAGLLLSLGSVASIVSRLTVGRAADRRTDGHLRGVALMVSVGVVGYLLLATGARPLMMIGTVLAFAFGWGFNGLFWFAVLRAHPGSPAAMTGQVMLGSTFGGLIGPLAFGFVADVWSYRAAWIMASSFAMAAAVTMVACDRMVARQDGAQPPR